MNLSKPIILQTIKPIGRMVSAFAPRCQTSTKVLQDLCLHRIQHLTDMALNLYLLWDFGHKSFSSANSWDRVMEPWGSWGGPEK